MITVKFRDAKNILSQRISANRSITPEGYLLCDGVILSYAGSFDYLPSEVGIASPSGVVKVERTEEEIFKPEAIASFNGKPIVIGHEEGFATPENWKDRAVGTVQNARREVRDGVPCLVADLLITDAEAIEKVQSGELPEVSCGYSAEITEDSPAHGFQTGFVGNHVALVKEARLGKMCHIGDSKMDFKSAIRKAFADGDSEAMENILSELNEEPAAPEAATPAPATEPEAEQDSDPMADIVARLAKLEEMLAKLLPAEDEAPATEADPEMLPPEEVFDGAEELDPEFKKPTAECNDSAIDAIKRKALKAAGVTKFGDVNSFSRQSLDIAFRAAVAEHRNAKNPTIKTQVGDSSAVSKIQMMQAAADKFWKNL